MLKMGLVKKLTSQEEEKQPGLLSMLSRHNQPKPSKISEEDAEEIYSNLNAAQMNLQSFFDKRKEQLQPK